MKVQLSHPERQVEIKGPKRVRELLRDLNLVAEAYLVIRGDDLVTEDELLKDEDAVEVRPVISGGSLQQSAVSSQPSANSYKLRTETFL
jgi:sulfur carrier protein